MTQLFYRDILGNNPRKREVSIEEINDKTSRRIAKKWVCKYFVEENYHSEDIDQLKDWIQEKKQKRCRKDCHIMRHVDSESGLNKIFCKVLGEFFIIWKDTVYKIVYINEIRIQIG